MWAVANSPGFSSRFDWPRRLPPGARGCFERGRYEPDLSGELPSGIGVDLEVHRRAYRNRGHKLLRNSQLHAQWIDAYYDGDFESFRDVVARGGETFSDQPGKWRPDDRVADGFLCERDSRACRLQRLVLLRGAAFRRFLLLPCGFHLRAPLIELRLRDHALIEQ
jgi:hypothetical protein